MIASLKQARAAHARRKAANKRGIGKAVRRFLKREGRLPSCLQQG